jgi:hypothetical protein
VLTAVLYLPVHAIRATILLLPSGTCGQQPYWPLIESLVCAGHAVAVADVRGIGAVEMRKRNHRDGFIFRSTEYRVAADMFLLGSSQVAARTFDVLRHSHCLRCRPELAHVASIGLYACGPMAIYGLCAAAVDDGLGPCWFADLPASWDLLFSGHPIDPARCCEATLAPEFRGRVDIPHLLCLAGQAGRRPVQHVGTQDAKAMPTDQIMQFLSPGFEGQSVRTEATA